MRSRWLNALTLVALILGSVFLSTPQAPAAARFVEEPHAASEASALSPQDREPPPHLQEVPAEIQELFADGMSAEDFVARTGHVPRALEDIVDGEALMIIELEEEPFAVWYAEQKDSNQLRTQATPDDYLQGLKEAQAPLKSELTEAFDVQIISEYAVVYNGFQALVPLSQLNEIRALPGVKAVHRAPIHEPALGASVDLIGVSKVREDLGFDGEGITIAIIDTGIDYTHAVFGGPGNPMAYDLNDPDMIEPNTFPTDKVVAESYDFAGTLYHAGCPAADEAAGICTRIPNPDEDPLDEYGHGTHVASIAAGLGAGDVMTGTAPSAKLIALKVFGQSGSTTLTLDALEWATLQYIYTGKPEVINMSLGAPFGTGDLVDPSVVGSQNAAEAGIVVVASAGNEGDNAYITGSPATADGAISVAASTTGYATGPTIGIEDTEYVTQTNIIYNPSSFDAGGEFKEEVKAPLGYVGNLTGAADNELCTTDGISAGALEDQVALIQRGSCAFTVKVNNAAELGAVAAIIFNNVGGSITMAGEPVVIPAGSIQLQDGLNLIPADGEIAVVSAEDDVTTVVDPYTPADSIATFSSRGPRGTDSFLKPEVTAPGVGIFAADMGSGIAGVSMSGTSMAAPHLAGVAALMAQANPDWTPENVKAAMMNTAVDLVDETTMLRSGAGRVDAYNAVDADVIAVGDEDLVSLNWGVEFSGDDSVELVKQVTLHNQGAEEETYEVAAALQNGSWTTGITLGVEPEEVIVSAGDSVDVDVRLTVDMTQIPVAYGSGGLEEVYGFVTFTPPVPYRLFLPLIVKNADATTPTTGTNVQSTKARDVVRVPFYLQPRPYAQLDLQADTVITDPSTDSAVITMTHTGPITSSTWIYPALTWNDAPDPAMTGPGDVRLFGLDYGWTDGNYGDMVVAAINTWDHWHVPQPYFAEFDLYIDADQDGVDDYVNFNFNYGWFGTGYDDNTWVVLQVDLATGDLYLASPYLIYTDYNASYMEWYLPAVWQDLGPSAPSFDYQLVGFDEDGVSVNPRGSFDYVHYPFDWGITNDPGPADEEALAGVWIADVGGYTYSQPQGVMLVDYNGDPRNAEGGQAYFEPVEIPNAFVQVAHLAPFAEDASVDIALNGVTVLPGVQYGDSTGYVPLDPGDYLVEIYPDGSTTSAISTTVELEQGKYYTAIAVGDGVNQDLALMALEDDLRAPTPGTFHLRLGHLAPFAAGDATADVRLRDGTPILEDVNFGDVNDFIPVPAGEYDLKITTPGGDTTLIDPLPVTLEEGEILSAFATGDGDNQDLGVFVLPAGAPGDFLPIPNVTILHTSDEHGWLQTEVPYGSPLTLGGVANLMGRLTQHEGYSPEADGFLLLSAGDNWTGPSISTWFEGEPVVEVMNTMGYDVSVIGNHEFDFGRDVLNQRIAEADFPFLSANIYYSGTTDLADFVTPYVIKEVNGIDVGIVGLSTVKTPQTTHPKNITDLTFGDYEEALRREVPKMRAEGADLIIVQAHVCSQNLIPLAADVADLDITLMQGGHCHDTYTGRVGETLIMEAHWAWRAYGKTALVVDPETYEVVDYTQDVVMNEYVTEEGNPVTPDPEIQDIADYWEAEVEDVMGEVIGYTETGMPRQSWKQLNYVMDSWLWAYGTADVAMSNWGGFRAGIPAGDITVGDIVGVLPFENRIVDCEITGSEVIDNLECCGDVAIAGITYTYHMDDGVRVVDAVTLTNGSPLVTTDTYSVLVNDFMYAGGDGFLFGDQDPDGYDTGIQWRQPVIDWTRAQDTSEANPIDPLIDDEPRAIEITP